MSTKSMWAHTMTAPATFNKVEVAAPTADDLAPGQVLLKVLVGGICGSDLPYFKGMVSPFGVSDVEGAAPATQLGGPLHEVVGQVVCSRDDSLSVDATVVGWATYMNALSEFIIVDGHDVHEFDSRLTPSEAIMLQPLACVIYALDQVRDIQGSVATVLGQGPIGVLFSHVLKARKASHVTGVDRVDRSELGELYGVDDGFWGTSDRWASTVGSAEPDIVIEAIGHQVSTLVDAVTKIKDGGQIYYFGIPDDPIYPFPMSGFLRKNAHLMSGYTKINARRDCLRRAGEHVRDHPEIVAPYLSHRFEFDEVEQAFTTAVTPSVGRLKVSLEV